VRLSKAQINVENHKEKNSENDDSERVTAFASQSLDANPTLETFVSGWIVETRLVIKASMLDPFTRKEKSHENG
jgi:hypothetical protein